MRKNFHPKFKLQIFEFNLIMDKIKKEFEIHKTLNFQERKTKQNLTYFATQILGSVVYQASVVQTGELKKVFQDKRYKNRKYEMIKRFIIQI